LQHLPTKTAADSVKYIGPIMLATCVFLLGCRNEGNTSLGSSTGTPTTPAPAPSADLQVVQEVFAELLKRTPQSIRPEMSMEQLPADDLDLVEAVMEIEDRLNISISDDAISRASEGAKPDQWLSRLTVGKLAEIVTASRQASAGSTGK
jgi:acyl carrier protein